MKVKAFKSFHFDFLYVHFKVKLDCKKSGKLKLQYTKIWYCISSRYGGEKEFFIWGKRKIFDFALSIMFFFEFFVKWL